VKRAYVVFNPVAGESGDHVCPVVESHLEAAGWDFEIYETTGDERIASVVDRALEQDELDFVVAAGGDGTVAGVAGGLIGREVPLGVVPLGTGNVFARELGIPEGTEGALELLTGDHVLVEVDAMEVEDQYFLLNVSVGLSSSMMRDTARTDKRRLGRLAYVWTGLKTLLGHQPHHFALTVDGERQTMRAAEIMIANSGAMGDPALRLSPEVKLNDGRVDVGIVQARSAVDYVEVALAVILGRQSEARAMEHLIAKQRVVVDTRSRLPVQGDGEFIGYPPIEAKVVPSAVRVVVPKKGSEGLVEGRLLGSGP